jgi:hypothetical protein
MESDNAMEQRRNPRGSSPPDVPLEGPADGRRGPLMGEAREEGRWTIWKAAYLLRRRNTFLRILGGAVKGGE